MNNEKEWYSEKGYYMKVKDVRRLRSEDGGQRKKM